MPGGERRAGPRPQDPPQQVHVKIVVASGGRRRAVRDDVEDRRRLDEREEAVRVRDLGRSGVFSKPRVTLDARRGNAPPLALRNVVGGRTTLPKALC